MVVQQEIRKKQVFEASEITGITVVKTLKNKENPYFDIVTELAQKRSDINMVDNNLFDRVNLRPISKQVAEDLTHKTNEIKQQLTLNFKKNKINQ